MRLIVLFFSFIPLFFNAQQHVPQNGIAPSKLGRYAFINATIVVSPEKTIENGVMIINNDRIEKISTFDLILPKDAVVIDCKGKTIVASFIETNTNVGLGKNTETTETAIYWNSCIHPESDAASAMKLDKAAFLELKKAGFGFANSHYKDGIARGTGTFISLGIDDVSKHLLKPQSAAVFSFKKGSARNDYPSSEMGSIALLRQTFYDAQWYKNNPKDANKNLSLEALNKQLNLPLFFDLTDGLDIPRANKVAKEFGLSFAFFGAGDEYQILQQLKGVSNPIVLPLKFPDAFQVKDPYLARQIALSELKHWELAPSNPYFLVKNGNTIIFTFDKNKTAEDFWKNLHLTMGRGLSEADAIRALTTNPAKYLQMEKDAGTLEEGKFASFTIFSNHPFRYISEVVESWNLGERMIHSSGSNYDIRGVYKINAADKLYELSITGSVKKPEAKIKRLILPTETYPISKTDTTSVAAFLSFVENDINIQWNALDTNYKGSVSLKGIYSPTTRIIEGDGLDPKGAWFRWNAYVLKDNPKDKEAKMAFTTKVIADSLIWYPNMAFGNDIQPKQSPIIIENATIWTNEAEGIIQNKTVIVKDGKITAITSDSFTRPTEVITIDAKNKHLTAGIIDEHSHIAISRGVNEGGQANTAEVNIGEVVTPNDINIYRQLAGGVTTSQLLHGSANPIGGQSGIIKLKWGFTADQMLIATAPKFIKFALGENVKQSNWGESQTYRFPQTRMGVEQVYIDAFSRAKKYDEARKKLVGKDGLLPNTFRRDLELDVIAEILNKELFITCHSYVQSEIVMLMHVADSFGFKVNTFTHILEGYKVADKMAQHGAAGSTFADWWAYKFEVNDAIPFNAGIMHNQGVLVGINSDDAEMGRRLNQEAAKIVKYGKISEIEAWKMVTLNPAKMLHLDDRMGSIKVGKDADLVVWSDNPLSINARVLYTIVDGYVLFDYSKDIVYQRRNDEEQARLITKMMLAEKEGAPTQIYEPKKPKHYHCDTLGEEGTLGANEH
jgi:imidazolonepropionase-like amidohydrolase